MDLHTLQPYASSGVIFSVPQTNPMNQFPWWNQLLSPVYLPGELIAIGFAIGALVLIFNGTLKRNKEAAQDYEGTLIGNVAALRDRVALLEKWRDEARTLEIRIDELEKKLEETELEIGRRDAEIVRLRRTLDKTKANLASAHAKIRRLEKEIADGKVTP